MVARTSPDEADTVLRAVVVITLTLVEITPRGAARMLPDEADTVLRAVVDITLPVVEITPRGAARTSPDEAVGFFEQ